VLFLQIQTMEPPLWRHFSRVQFCKTLYVTSIYETRITSVMRGRRILAIHVHDCQVDVKLQYGQSIDPCLVACAACGTCLEAAQSKQWCKPPREQYTRAALQHSLGLQQARALPVGRVDATLRGDRDDGALLCHRLKHVTKRLKVLHTARAKARDEARETLSKHTRSSGAGPNIEP